jgi:PAS domain S-box-containing protein
MAQKLDKPSQLLHWYHWLVISASLLLTIIAWKISDNQIQEKRSELFKIQTEQLLEQISERMSHYEVALKAGAAAIQTFAQEKQADNWKSFSERLNITDTYPGINGIGIIYYVPQGKASQFIAQQRKYRANFNIHPQHEEQEYWPITYIEPLKGNEKAVGLDMAFESNRFSAAKKARDTATTQITAPIVLVQDAKKTPGFLQYIPFYSSTDIETPKQRQIHFVGHVYAPFIMVKLMEGTLKQSNRQLVFSISDGDDNLYNELTPNNSYYDNQPIFQKALTIDMYGRPWTFNIQTALSFKASTHSNQPLIILGSGIVIDAMLLFIFITLTRSQKKALAIAEDITKALSIKEKYYKHIIESAPCGMIITNSQGEIEIVNPQTELLFGYKSHELIGNKIDMLIPKRFQKQHPKFRENFNNNPSNRQMGLNREVFGLTKKDNEFPAEIGLAQFKYGDSLKTLATVIDMTEHVQTTEELKRSNKELNDFAYVASHDLKAPLRGIMQLSSWIEEDIADFATDDTKSNLALLMNRTSRLENLLEDLLTYSRIGRKVGDIQTIKVCELVLSIFDLQSPPEGVSLICQNTLPELKTHLIPLEIIFRNLISNAIKHRNNDKLIITISTLELPTHYQFSVEDNGPGIPAKHHNQIFELFKTLKPRDEVEGSGMGLSIIKKLLEYQKCAINVSSDGENGTCFTFTWPK